MALLADTQIDPPPAEVSQVVDHLFRHESGKIIGTLIRIFGIEHWALAEDVVQETLVRALQIWPFNGIPENPSAWLIRVARNLAMDVLRREKVFRSKEPAIIQEMEESASLDAGTYSEEDVVDDRLRLMFVCCHPALTSEVQVALALKTLCGFSPAEIANAFLTTEAAIAKRLTRARQRIRDAHIRFEIPVGSELTERLDGVLQALYLLFNEGYKASIGKALVKPEVCDEAMRLTTLLAGHPSGDRPETHALLALMTLTAARLPARVDSDGNLLRLQEQDRGLWDRALIAKGLVHLAHSAHGVVLTEYHLQAGIAACHCMARDYESTDWPAILAFYDKLVLLNQSPVIALNRAVAVANVHGPDAGIAAVEEIPNQSDLHRYYLFYAVLGEFETRRHNRFAASEQLHRALDLAQVPSERTFLSARLHQVDSS